MTLEELQVLKPSFENPVRFKRKKEILDLAFEYLDVTHVHGERVVIIMVENNFIDVISWNYLFDNYQLDKPKPKYEVLYECLDFQGGSGFCLDGNRVIDLENKKERKSTAHITKIPNGDKLLLNMETWEVCEYDEGLL